MVLSVQFIVVLELLKQAFGDGSRLVSNLNHMPLKLHNELLSMVRDLFQRKSILAQGPHMVLNVHIKVVLDLLKWAVADVSKLVS